MKPHPRIRKTIKWSGAVVTLLLVVPWIGSCWWSVSRCDRAPALDDQPEDIIAVAPGVVLFSSTADHLRISPKGFWNWGRYVPGLHAPWYRQRTPFQWWFDSYSSPPSFPFQSTELIIPLWPLPAMAIIPTALAWYLDARARRRERFGRCPKCGYDRTGLAAGAVCPECGAGNGEAMGQRV